MDREKVVQDTPSVRVRRGDYEKLEEMKARTGLSKVYLIHLGVELVEEMYGDGEARERKRG